MKKNILNNNIVVLCFYNFVVLSSECLGDESYLQDDNINKYLFDGRVFKFVDLTLSLNKQFAKLSADEKSRVRQADGYDPKYNFIDFCVDIEWIGTSLDLKHKYVPHTTLRNKNLVQQRHTDAVPLERLVVPLIIADISSQVNGDPNFSLKKHHLDFFLNNYFGNTAQPCIIVFKFGWWTKHKYDIRRYYGLSDGTNGTSGTPGISEEVAKWITSAYKNVIGVGVDLPSVDSGSSVYVAHNTLVDAGLYVVTNVNLEQYLPDAWCTALLLPQAGQGAKAPVRFVAICPKSRMERHEIPFHRL
ncbi:hypothetical protein ABMA27_001465 [Loxostege sticticalis]|uniref:Uncharacterized protein n=1 Tax=Loxostege sticticalis TaxID=481309 RepID=A0ABR3HYV1_LOXSC